mmetsp:Transcript_12429/g.14030  ORF Transcript_12429/g.14030 Transcript_12429/m.14030 type:complete len:498 (-) Transcript_12429:218-1711(-)
MVIVTVSVIAAASAAAAAGTASGLVYRKLIKKHGDDEEDSSETTENTEPASIAPSDSRGLLRVMFLSADAGGGHKASAAALAKQFEMLYPGSICESFHLEEVLPSTWPYSDIATSYKTLTSNPNVWRTIYHVSNAKPFQKFMDWHCLTRCEEVFIKLIAAFNPDVIVSVHPNLNLVPCSAARKVGRNLGKKIPFFTVVTDLGSGHDGWFQRDVDKLYLASEKIRELCIRRGRTPEESIVLTGLPIRHEFELMAEKRKKEPPEVVKQDLKVDLDLDNNIPMVLVMGGGEGVGSLRQIVKEMYLSFFDNNIDATICVVCAKNQELKQAFENTNWDQVVTSRSKTSLSSAVDLLKRKLDGGDEPEHSPSQGNVTVLPLGFVTRMAEYMAAADVLITKAGPGTIAEAASMGLPVLLTNFLPGQEAGNVGLVSEQGFGEYNDRPRDIANVVTKWMQEPETYLKKMSENALAFGHPEAGKEIALDIGSQTHAWLEWNKTGCAC